MNAAAHPAVSSRRPLLKRFAPSRLARSLIAPHLFDFWASRLHPTWTWERPLARIVARQAESSDTFTLLLQPNRHWRGFVAGQHINVSAEIDGIRVTRSYSLSDAPRADGRIAITVKAIPGGKLSEHLCRSAKVGDVLDLGRAFGEMTLPETADGRWLFLAAGSGITPMMAMIRAQAAQGMPMPIALIYWARTRAELCFVDELRALAARQPSFRVDFIVTREADAADVGHGRIDTTSLSTLAPDLHHRRVFACGSDGFVAGARSAAAARAVAFHAEAFTPPLRAALDDSLDHALDDAGTVTITLAASGRTLDLPRGESLLSALEAAGMKLPSGCRMGLCNTCACGKRGGSTRHLHTGAIEHEPVSALRLCVNSARSDLILDL
jgi:stearoyl-CoA 9-desaturase NADPH oxidoreductase